MFNPINFKQLRKHWPSLNGHTTRVRRGVYYTSLFSGPLQRLIDVEALLKTPADAKCNFEEISRAVKRQVNARGLGKMLQHMKVTPHSCEFWISKKKITTALK